MKKKDNLKPNGFAYFIYYCYAKITAFLRGYKINNKVLNLVGRGALGNPWLFGQIDAAVRGLPLPPAPALAQRMALLCAQAKAMCEEKGELNAMRQMRGQAAFYMKGLRGAAKLRGLSTGLTVYEDAEKLAALVLELNSTEAIEE